MQCRPNFNSIILPYFTFSHSFNDLVLVSGDACQSTNGDNQIECRFVAYYLVTNGNFELVCRSYTHWTRNEIENVQQSKFDFNRCPRTLYSNHHHHHHHSRHGRYCKLEPKKERKDSSRREKVDLPSNISARNEALISLTMVGRLVDHWNMLICEYNKSSICLI